MTVTRVHTRSRAFVVIALALSLVVSACSGSGDEPSADEDASGVDFSSLSLPSGDPYSDFQIVHDDGGALAVEVPDAWSDVDGRPAELEDVMIAGVWAAPKIDGFKDDWTEPGVSFETRPGELAEPGAESVLAERADAIDESGSCAESEGAQPYETDDHSGFYELWSDCGDPEAALLYVVVDDNDDPEDTLLVLDVQMLTQADIEAAEKALDTFQYDPDAAPDTTSDAEDVTTTAATADLQPCAEAMTAYEQLLDLQDQAIEQATAGISAGRTGDDAGLNAATSKLAEIRGAMGPVGDDVAAANSACRKALRGVESDTAEACRTAIGRGDELSAILSDVVTTATQAISAYNAGDTAGLSAAVSSVAELRGKASVIEPDWGQAAATCQAG